MYHDLDTWRLGMTLAKKVYRTTADLPASEKFALTDQLRRAAVSIPSNIAEGSGRRTRNDYLRHLYISRGSLNELRTQLRLAHELEYLRDGDLEELVDLLDRLEATLQNQIESLHS